MRNLIVDVALFWHIVVPMLFGIVCLTVLAVSAVVAAVMRIVRRIRSNGG